MPEKYQITNKEKTLESGNWVSKQLSELKDQIQDGISVQQAISILDRFKTAEFSKNKNTPQNSTHALLAIQVGLKHLGFDPGNIDALYGPATKGAILRFQEKWNAEHPSDEILTDGIPGPQTIGKLIETLSVPEAEAEDEPLGMEPKEPAPETDSGTNTDSGAEEGDKKEEPQVDDPPPQADPGKETDQSPAPKPQEEPDREAESKGSQVENEYVKAEWENQKAILDYLVDEYPGLSCSIAERANTRMISFRYSSDTLKQNFEWVIKPIVILPTQEGGEVEFLAPEIENPENMGNLVQGAVAFFKETLEEPAKRQLEEQLGKSKRDLLAGRWEKVIDSLRPYYSPKSLELEVLLGLKTEISGFFTGGLLGQDPVEVEVVKPENEIGLKISGGKRGKNKNRNKNKIFYSLESKVNEKID